MHWMMFGGFRLRKRMRGLCVQSWGVWQEMRSYRGDLDAVCACGRLYTVVEKNDEEERDKNNNEVYAFWSIFVYVGVCIDVWVRECICGAQRTQYCNVDDDDDDSGVPALMFVSRHREHRDLKIIRSHIYVVLCLFMWPIFEISLISHIRSLWYYNTHICLIMCDTSYVCCHRRSDVRSINYARTSASDHTWCDTVQPWWLRQRRCPQRRCPQRHSRDVCALLLLENENPALLARHVASCLGCRRNRVVLHCMLVYTYSRLGGTPKYWPPCMVADTLVDLINDKKRRMRWERTMAQEQSTVVLSPFFSFIILSVTCVFNSSLN